MEFELGQKTMPKVIRHAQQTIAERFVPLASIKNMKSELPRYIWVWGKVEEMEYDRPLSKTTIYDGTDTLTIFVSWDDLYCPQCLTLEVGEYIIIYGYVKANTSEDNSASFTYHTVYKSEGYYSSWRPWACPNGSDNDDLTVSIRQSTLTRIVRGVSHLSFETEKQCYAKIEAMVPEKNCNKDELAGLLLSAIYGQSLPLAHYALDRGACCNLTGCPVLLAAIRQNDTAMVELLLSAGADPHFNQEEAHDDDERLWYCKSLEMALQCNNEKMTKLIWEACGYDIPQNRSKAFYYAVKQSSYSLAQWLLERDASYSNFPTIIGEMLPSFGEDFLGPHALKLLQHMAEKMPDDFCDAISNPAADTAVYRIGAEASLETIAAFEKADIPSYIKQCFFSAAVKCGNLSVAEFYAKQGQPFPIDDQEYHTLYLKGEITQAMHHILQDVYQENTVNILPLLQENAAAGLGTPIHVPLENILQKYSSFDPERLKGKFDILQQDKSTVHNPNSKS